MRNSILNGRHVALGSKLDGDTWNDMPVPWSYNTCADDEVVAVRTRAGLYDVSALNIVHVTGVDAESVLDQLVAKDVTRLKDGDAIIAVEVDEAGALCDDIMIIRDTEHAFMVSHGSGKTLENLLVLAKGKKVEVAKDNDVHILSLQGPKSLEILAPHVGFKLADLPYFKFEKTTIFGKNVMIGRGGYSGERGYEVYCSAKDAVEVWDKILEAGQPFGTIAASWNSLELTRIEAALSFFPYEMPEGDTTPWEVGLGWGVDLDKKGTYTGKEAVLMMRGRERVKQVGLVCQSSAAVEAGSKVMKDGKVIGVITSASYSRYLMLSLALVHIKPEHSQIGTVVDVVGKSRGCKAKVVQTPFYDPMRLRTHPENKVV